MSEWGNWEKINVKETEDGGALEITSRMKVPNGWIVKYLVSVGGKSIVQMCFVPYHHKELVEIK